MEPKVATITMNPTVDRYVTVKLLSPDRKLRCAPSGMEPGGGGLNVSRALMNLGFPSRAYYTSGGETGRLLQELLQQEGLVCCPLPIANAVRENVTVLEESTGLHYRFVMPGPLLSEEEWRRCLESLEKGLDGAEYVIASGSLPPGVPVDFFARIARFCRTRNLRFILDTAGEALRLAAAEGVFLLKPNLPELMKLSGDEIHDRIDQETTARRMVEEGKCEVLVLSLGGAGVLAVTGDETVRFMAPPVKPVSKIGAGDSMVAGIVASLLRGGSIRDAVKYGTAAGTAAVLSPGTQLCRREETESLEQRITEI